MTDNGKLAGQTAWVTGAASGMGAAVARLFVDEGAAVAAVDIQAEPGAQVAAQITELGGTAEFHDCDVTDSNAVKASLDKAAASLGPPSIIVNCAGIVHVAKLDEYPESDWDQLMGVNLKSVYLSVRHGMQYLRKHERSYMVNIASVGSFIAQGDTPAYIASKYAVLGLSNNIAVDYARDGLRCNCVCPGITDTPMLRYHLSTTPDPEETLAMRLKRVPTGVVITPEQIARAVLYLSCEDSAGITGTSLVVDGGYIAPAEWETDITRFMDNQEA